MPDKTPSFTDIETRGSGRRALCARCGARDQNAGQVGCVLRHANSNETVQQGVRNKHIAAKNHTMCEPCSVLVWRAVVAAYDEELNRG
jgi:hypothetical protein